jgi:hypothetical protein
MMLSAKCDDIFGKKLRNIVQQVNISNFSSNIFQPNPKASSTSRTIDANSGVFLTPANSNADRYEQPQTRRQCEIDWFFLLQISNQSAHLSSLTLLIPVKSNSNANSSNHTLCINERYITCSLHFFTPNIRH